MHFLPSNEKCHTSITLAVLFVSVIIWGPFQCRAFEVESMEVVYSFGDTKTNQLGFRVAGELLEGADGKLYGYTTSGGLYGQGTLFRGNKDGTEYEDLWSFGQTVSDAIDPIGQLVEGKDGMIFGVTRNGGLHGTGTIYKLKKDGTGFSIIWHFDRDPRGYSYEDSIIEGSDGLLYGVTRNSKVAGTGIIYRLNKGGTHFEILKKYEANDFLGSAPNGPLLEGRDQVLYGATWAGGRDNVGTIFRLNKDGTDYRVIKHFEYAAREGSSPNEGLIQASDGALYGSTKRGAGTNSLSSVFKLNPDGSGYTILHMFDGSPNFASESVHRLVEASNGKLYGFERKFTGSLYGFFSLNKDGSEFTSFNPLDKYQSSSRLLVSSDGFFYGSTSSLIYQMNRDGTSLINLRIFREGGGDGIKPENGPIIGTDGWLYGVTGVGGKHGGGMLYKVAKDGQNYSVLKNFGELEEDGAIPVGRLVEGRDGALYGVTESGGSHGNGTLFKLSKDGSNYMVLKSFYGSREDGEMPGAGLMEASDGMLYGTTRGGGISSFGIVFRIDKEGTNYEILKEFRGLDGRVPDATLIEGNDGWLYGTTAGGGELYNSGLGLIYKMEKSGANYTVMHRFNADEELCCYAHTPLLEGPDNFLYGTTQEGIYKIRKEGGNPTIVRVFYNVSEPNVGRRSRAPLIWNFDGALLGTTEGGGNNKFGTVFQINPDGTAYKNIWSFQASDSRPVGQLSIDPMGVVFGAISTGGVYNLGAVFRLTPKVRNIPNTYGIIVNAPFPDQFADYGDVISLPLPTDVFLNPDSNIPLTFTIRNLPPGLTFNPETESIIGQTRRPATNIVTITATDHEFPPYTTNIAFNFSVAPGTLILQVDDVFRECDQPNPPLTATLTGVVFGDDISFSLATAATETSPLGDYPITAQFNGFLVHLVNYKKVVQAGTLFIQDSHPPELTLSGADGITLECAVDSYVERGALVMDICDPDPMLFIGGDEVNTRAVGNYQINYVARDASRNESERQSRRVAVRDTRPPMVISESLLAEEDTPLSQRLQGNDLCAGELLFTLVEAPKHGGLELDPRGYWSYEPVEDFHGTDSFSFHADDGWQQSEPGTISLTILPVNDPPVASSLNLLLEEDQTLTLTLSAEDPDHDTLSYELLSHPAHGVLHGEPPHLVYYPDLNFHGFDKFEFQVNDGELLDTGIVSLEVVSVNDAPLARINVAPLFFMSGVGEPLVILAENGSTAEVVLDGTGSEDVEGDALEWGWFEGKQVIPFATGSVTTNVFNVGPHDITLVVHDGQDAGQAETSFDVITPGLAVEEVIILVEESTFDRVQKRPLLASLKAGLASFDRQATVAALNQLRALQNKVRAQLSRDHPEEAAEISVAIGRIIRAMEGESK